MAVNLRESHDVSWDGTHNSAIMSVFVDNNTDLIGLSHLGDVYFQLGSDALDVSTGYTYRMKSDYTWILQSSGGGGGEYVITPVVIDLSNETWESRNFAYGTSTFVITCNKIIEIPQNAVSVSAEITLANGYRADSCFQFFADASQVQAYDKTDASSYTNNDYADGWQSTSESEHILPYLSGRYAFEFAIARNPIASHFAIQPSDLTACTITFYCVQSV